MNTTRAHTWQNIQKRIKSNIESKKWSPGDLIPGEVSLAKEYGCSRTTVNRALRELAATGIIDRKRKSGTRVAVLPARQVRAQIPVIRTQVESQHSDYSFRVVRYKSIKPEQSIRKRLQLSSQSKALNVQSIHYCDGQPFIHENRWVNTQTVPRIKNVDLSKISANEWLVENVPFTSGEFVIEAANADNTIAQALAINVGEAILTSKRTTWLDEQSVTTVELSYVSGYQMRFEV